LRRQEVIANSILIANARIFQAPAGLPLVEPDQSFTVTQQDPLYKCGWSPLEGYACRSSVPATLANGQVVWQDGHLTGPVVGQRLSFG